LHELELMLAGTKPAAMFGEEWRIDALHELNLVVRNKLRSWTAADERETGRLLGYTDAEVEAFLKWTNRLSG
jgi:hypothetical protein